MLCSKCGVENSGEAKSCKDCGQPLGNTIETRASLPQQHAVIEGGKPPKRVLYYALVPTAAFILVGALWATLNVVTDAINPSPAVSFFNNTLAPWVLFFCFLAITIGTIYAIYANYKDYDGTGVVKCSDCGFVGQGKNGRSTVYNILAWMASILFPPTLMIYYMHTHRYLCPKCNSSSVEMRNRAGVFTAHSGRVSRSNVGLLFVMCVMIVLGTLAFIVVTSLQNARLKERVYDSQARVTLSNIQAQAKIYYDSNSNSFSA